MKSISLKYFTIIFLEGCSVMAVEILGGKVISSFYGSSLFVWTSVIGVTLIALTLGYYIGGFLSTKKNLDNKIFNLLCIASILIVSIPSIATLVMSSLHSKGVLTGAIMSAMLIVAPSLVLLGTITPIIIKIHAQQIELSGKISGIIYSITTVGGILTTILFGFFIIPLFGISYPLICISLILAYYNFYFFYEKKNVVVISLLVTFFSIPLLYFLIKKNPTNNGSYIKINESEGILGQLKVADQMSRKDGETRRLLINGIPQSWIEKSVYKNSMWDYPHIISSIASNKPSGSNAAVFGFGGGSVAKELTELGFSVDAVDIDARVFKLAKTFFYYDDSKTSFTVDDARHYFRKSKNKYDVIVIDLLNGEVQPSYVFSKGSFLDVKKMLKSDGLLIINFQGNPTGVAAHSIFKTLIEAGYFVNFSQNGDAINDVNDIIFTASINKFDLSKSKFERANKCCLNKLRSFYSTPVKNNLVNMEHALVLEDDRPLLDYLNSATILKYRYFQSVQGSLIDQEIRSGANTFK